LAWRSSKAYVLADAIAAGDLGLYEAARRELLRRTWMMSKQLIRLDLWPALRERATQIFKRQPNLFARSGRGPRRSEWNVSLGRKCKSRMAAAYRVVIEAISSLKPHWSLQLTTSEQPRLKAPKGGSETAGQPTTD